MFVHEVANFFLPWNTVYADSTALSTGVTATHILALLIGGGLALAADRSTLRMLARPEAERRRHLEELRAVHRPVLIALAVLFLSGLAMAAADVETFATSWYFWIKMALVTLLLANGYYLLRTERRLHALATAPAPLPAGDPAAGPYDAGLALMPSADETYATAVAAPAVATPTTEAEPDGLTTGLWRHLRRASLASLALWTLTALAGAILTGAA
jgi:hypothetical protein